MTDQRRIEVAEQGLGWRPRVSAIVPAYKSAEFIQATLDSLAAQTWTDLEIVIGDDASPDGTADVIRRFASGRTDVQVVLREQNLGWIENTNDLMDRATGDFMFYMPHDDRIEPDYVERLANALVANPRAVIAFSDLSFRDGDGPAVEVSFDRLNGVSSPIVRSLIFVTRPHGWWVPHRGLFRAEAFRMIGGLKTSDAGDFAADATWLFAMTLLGEFVRVPASLYHKVWMPESVSKTWGTKPERRGYSGGALHNAALEAVRASHLRGVQRAILIAGLLALRPLRWLRWRADPRTWARRHA